MRKLINRNEKGITLIALVVTIVILLILAGVAILMLSGENGILKNTQKATSEHTIGKEKEEMQLAIMEAMLEGKGKFSYPALDNKLPAGITGSNGKYTSSTTGNVFTVDGNGNMKLNGDSEVFYDITFKDLTKITDWSGLLPYSDDDIYFQLWFMSEDGVIGSIEAKCNVSPKENDGYSIACYPNEEQGLPEYYYRHDSMSENDVWYGWDENNQKVYLEKMRIKKVRFLTEEEVQKVYEENLDPEELEDLGEDFKALGTLYENFTVEQLNQLLDIKETGSEDK